MGHVDEFIVVFGLRRVLNGIVSSGSADGFLDA